MEKKELLTEMAATKLTKKLSKELKEYAKSTDRPESWVIRKALEQYLSKK